MKTVKKNSKRRDSGKTVAGKTSQFKREGSSCTESQENLCTVCEYVVTLDDCGCINYERYCCY